MASGRNRTQGAILICDPDSGNSQIRTFTCIHCNRVVQVAHGASPDKCGGFCFRCDAPTCLPCAKQGTCTPFEKKIDQMEAKARSLESMGFG